MIVDGKQVQLGEERAAWLYAAIDFFIVTVCAVFVEPVDVVFLSRASDLPDDNRSRPITNPLEQDGAAVVGRLLQHLRGFLDSSRRWAETGSVMLLPPEKPTLWFFYGAVNKRLRAKGGI